MKTVGAHEAKTRFSQLLDEVNGGATIIITKHGVPVARMIPVVERSNAHDAIERWLEKRKDVTLPRSYDS